MKRFAQHIIALVTAALGYGLCFVVCHAVVAGLLPHTTGALFLLAYWTPCVFAPVLAGLCVGWTLYCRTLGLAWAQRWPLKLEPMRRLGGVEALLGSVALMWVL